MKIINEGKEEIYCNLEVEFEDGEYDLFYTYGLKEIVMDKEAVIEYMIKKALTEYVEKQKKKECTYCGELGYHKDCEKER